MRSRGCCSQDMLGWRALRATSVTRLRSQTDELILLRPGVEADVRRREGKPYAMKFTRVFRASG